VKHTRYTCPRRLFSTEDDEDDDEAENKRVCIKLFSTEDDEDDEVENNRRLPLRITNVVEGRRWFT
jgi:hypothetical protein